MIHELILLLNDLERSDSMGCSNNGSRNIAYTNLDLGLYMDLWYVSSLFCFYLLQFVIVSSNIHLDIKYSIVLRGTSIFVDALHLTRVSRL